MKLYLLTGLGADARLFSCLKFPSGYEPVYLNWIKPFKNETLETYALRMAEHISDDEPYGILGVSFGGMLAIEIARHLKPARTIIISSVQSYNELPFYYRWAGKLRLHYLLPPSLFRQASLVKRLFTTETKEEKKLLRDMIRQSDPAFIKWALRAIIEWKGQQAPEGVVHIHGTKDELLPLRCTSASHQIQGGTHLMVLSSAEEINKVVGTVLG